jgi:hypothetical protein
MSEADPNGMLPLAPDEGEIVEARPSGSGLESRRSAAALPAVQAAAAAAGGFVAGAAVVGLVGRHHRRRALNGSPSTRSLLGRRRNTTAADRLQIVGSRSLLLDVHLLGGSGAGR